MPLTDLHKKSISEAHKKVGVGKWMKGRKMSAETKEKIRSTMKILGKSPEFRERVSRQNIQYYDRIGRVPKRPYKHDTGKEYKEWRREVFERYKLSKSPRNGAFLLKIRRI